MAKRLRAVLLDLSGTLHVGDEATRDASAALAKLRAALPTRACSNTSKESRASLISRLERMGLRFERRDVFSSLAAAAALCRSRDLHPLLLLSSSAKEDFEGLETGAANADAVVIGLAPEALDYAHLDAAFRVLVDKRRDARLIATHRALYVKADDGELSLGPGGFVAALEQASEKRAIVVGKPTEAFFEQALASLERDGVGRDAWRDVAIVGDDYRNDLGGGAETLGLRRYLVRTGKYRDGDEDRVEGLAGVYDDFAAFVDAVIDAGDE